MRKHRTLSRGLLKDHQKLTVNLCQLGQWTPPDPNTQNTWIQHRELHKYWITREMSLYHPFVSKGESEELVISENHANAEKHSETRVLCVVCSSGCILMSLYKRDKWIQLRILKKIAEALQVIFQRAVWRQFNYLSSFFKNTKILETNKNLWLTENEWYLVCAIVIGGGSSLLFVHVLLTFIKYLLGAHN